MKKLIIGVIVALLSVIVLFYSVSKVEDDSYKVIITFLWTIVILNFEKVLYTDGWGWK